MLNEYDLGYYEGVRNVCHLYHRCLMRIAGDEGLQLMLDSEAFVTELNKMLQEAHELRYRDEPDLSGTHPGGE